MSSFFSAEAKTLLLLLMGGAAVFTAASSCSQDSQREATSEPEEREAQFSDALLDALPTILGKAAEAGIEEVRSVAPPGRADGPVYIDFTVLDENMRRVSKRSFDREGFTNALSPDIKRQLYPFTNPEEIWEPRSDSSSQAPPEIAQDGLVIAFGPIDFGPGKDGAYKINVDAFYNDGDEYTRVPSLGVNVTMRKQNGRWRVADVSSSEYTV